jgi:erythromycin esterase
MDGWIKGEAIPFDLGSPASIDSAVDRILRELGEAVELLGFGEALHGSEEILLIRNRLFQRLVAAHGYSAFVLEATSPQARVIDDYVTGRRDASDPAVLAWFADGFGRLNANRELIEWMREHNVNASSPPLHFYGFDLPLGAGALSSPARVFDIVLTYLDGVEPDLGKAWRARIAPLLGESADWERPAAWFDPAQSIGRSEHAIWLRIAALDLVTDLRIRGPELSGQSDPLAFADALHHAEMAVKLLNAHAALAEPGAYARVLSIRDLIMADNLRHYLTLERGRGKVLVFSAAGHLKRGRLQWHLPPEPEVKEWPAAGSHLDLALGARYAVISMALGSSEANAVAEPEPGTIEAHLLRAGGPVFIPTRPARGLTAPVRTGSDLNPTYFTLTASSFEEFDALVFLPTTSYPRGAEPLSSWSG